jgi:hypothetical protein
MHEKRSIHGFNVVRSLRRGRALAAGLATLLLCVSSAAAPGDVSKFPINEDNPSASIPPTEARNASPLQFGYFLQDLYTRGELAFESRDWATSSKYFEAIAKVVTDRARAFSKLCEAYQHQGKLEAAKANCARAIVLPGATWLDHKRFVELSLAQKSLTPGDVADVEASIAHVRSQFAALPERLPPSPAEVEPVGSGTSAADATRTFEELKAKQRERKEANQSDVQRAGFIRDFEGLACRLALRLRDANRLARCIDELKRQNAEPRVLLTFEWAKALVARDRARSLELLEQAKQLEIPAATLSAMAREQNEAFGLLAWLERYESLVGAVLAVVVILGGTLAWVRRVRRSVSSSKRSAAAGAAAAS